MLQGATETVATTLTCGLSYLCSSEDGRQIQSDAYDAIVARFGTPQEAYDKAFHFEDVPYIIALYKEILRYYCIVPFGTPRGASKDFQLKSGAIIPRGTTLLMNAELANHGMYYAWWIARATTTQR
jgi:cytochrome P450